MTTRRVAALLLGLLLQAGCALNVTPMLTPGVPRVCTDGLPPKLFLGERCQNGVCGYTCEPGRWPPPPPVSR